MEIKSGEYLEVRNTRQYYTCLNDSYDISKLIVKVLSNDTLLGQSRVQIIAGFDRYSKAWTTPNYEQIQYMGLNDRRAKKACNLLVALYA